MKRLLTLARFSNHHHMERLIVECARNNDMQVSGRNKNKKQNIIVLILTKNLYVLKNKLLGSTFGSGCFLHLIKKT